MRYALLFFVLTITSIFAADKVTSPRGGQLFPKKKPITKPALPPLPPGFQLFVDTNLHMTSIKKTNATSMHIAWSGPTGTVFQLLTKTNVLQSQWTTVGPETTNRSTTVPINTRFSIFEVKKAGAPPPVPGTLQWLRAQSNSIAATKSIKLDHLGNLIAVGSFSGIINFGTGPIGSMGGSDVFIIKYTPQGTIVWIRTFGATENDAPQSVSIDSANNIIVIGYFNYTVNVGGVSLVSNGGTDIFIAKYSPDGVVLWAKNFGGVANDSGQGVVVDTRVSNEILLAASFALNVNFGTFPLSCPGTGLAVVKLSNAGTVVWAKAWGDAGQGQCQVTPYDLAVDKNGDLIVAGEYAVPSNFGGGIFPASSVHNLFVAGYSGVNGNYRWAKSATANGSANQGRGVTVDPVTGNVILTGNIQGNVDLGCGVITATGATLFLASYNSTGNCQWVKTFPNGDAGSGGWGFAATVDVGGDIYLTGQINGAVGFGGGQYLISSGGSRNMFMAAFSPVVGNTPPAYRWGKCLQGSGDSNGSGITLDTIGNLVVCGFFIQTKDFGGITVTGSSNGSSFVAAYTK